MAGHSHPNKRSGPASQAVYGPRVAIQARPAGIVWRPAILAFLAALLLACALGAWQLSASPMGAGTTQIVHVVARGETLTIIAERYNVSPGAIARANKLGNPNLIHSGLRLLIPVPSEMLSYDTYIIMPGDTLSQIAERYGTTVLELMRLNDLPTSSSTYVDQVIQVPVLPTGDGKTTPGEAVIPMTISMPVTETTEMSTTAANMQFIHIDSPAPGEVVTNPMTVSGYGNSYDRFLSIRVLDATGEDIGNGRALVDAPAGSYGPFTSQITLTMPMNEQTIRVQVFSLNPQDGGLEQLNSRSLVMRGLGLDAAIDIVKKGLESGDLDSVGSVMAQNNFSIGAYLALDQELQAGTALERLRVLYDNSKDVKVDLTVDGQKLLQPFNFGENVLWVAYSTGWGVDGHNDAFLIFRDINNRAVWSGLVYVISGLKPY